ncbi:MAG: cell division protein ZapB [Desulfobacteraceae bacterium]
MDIEIIVQKFDEIENKVEQLIETTAALEAANAELMEKNEQLEQELQGMREKEHRNEEVKVLIRNKIESLMGRLGSIAET